MERRREIVFDTETTGFSPEDDRIVEIGCVEMNGHSFTGRTFHVYVNPGRAIGDEAAKVHGLTSARLRGEKPFSQIAPLFLEFVGDADLVAHNAEFDMGFINAELARNSFEPIDPSRFIDTLGLAHKKVPSLSRYTLDSLCKYYGIDNSMRDLHGALLDAELLAQVYIELLGGREIDFFKADESGASVSRDSLYSAADGPKKRLEPRDFKASGEELAAHEEFIKSLGSGAFWLDA